MPRTSGTPSRLIDRTDAQAVQRAPISARRVRRYSLAVDQVRPVIRIAHRVVNPLTVAQRVIVDFEIVFIARGRTTLHTDRAIALPAGSLVVIPPFVRHAFESRGIVEHVAVHFDLAAAVPGTAAAARSAAYAVDLSHGQSIPTCVPVAAGSAVRSSLDRIVETFNDRSPAAELECSSLLGAILATLMAKAHTMADRSADHDPHRWRLQKVIDYIDAHLGQPLESELLAQQLDLSPSRFRTVFGRLMGVSPHQYVTQRRIALARKLLAGDEHTIKQIARLAGFADEFHFSKTFRHVDGLPPSVYRAQARASRF